jgi:hypothetical protein
MTDGTDGLAPVKIGVASLPLLNEPARGDKVAARQTGLRPSNGSLHFGALAELAVTKSLRDRRATPVKWVASLPLHFAALAELAVTKSLRDLVTLPEPSG